MRAARTPPSAWLHLLQALVAREAVEQMGLSGRRAARLLGIAPSAVSQYLSGQRLGRRFADHATSEGARRSARATAERLRAGEPGGAGRTRTILAGTGELAELFEGPTGEDESGPRRGSRRARGGPPIPSRAMAKWLRHRIQAEQAAVAQSMRLAQRARDELTRAILRQIASDSLRHAEIVASLATYLDRGVATSLASGITPREVHALIENERRAEAASEIDIARHLGGTLALLIASMEADERKHTELLRGLLASGFESSGDAPGPARSG